MGMDLVPVIFCANCDCAVTTRENDDGTEYVVHFDSDLATCVPSGTITAEEGPGDSELTDDGHDGYYNSYGWRVMGDVLEQLGCDVSFMDGLNDGRIIPAKITRQYGEALTKALAENRVLVRNGDASQGAAGEFPGEFLILPDSGSQDMNVGTALDESNRHWLQTCADYWLKCGSVHQF